MLNKPLLLKVVRNGNAFLTTYVQPLAGGTKASLSVTLKNGNTVNSEPGQTLKFKTTEVLGIFTIGEVVKKINIQQEVINGAPQFVIADTNQDAYIKLKGA